MYKRRNSSRYTGRKYFGRERRRIRTFDPRKVIAEFKKNNGEDLDGWIDPDPPSNGYHGSNKNKDVNPPRSQIEPSEVKNEFFDLNLDKRLSENIKACGYQRPTPIQDQAIPHILEGKDLVGIANTGTGKTAAFLIPLINKVHLNSSSRVLVIAPTRELAIQIEREFSALSQNMNIHSAICIGGVSINGQIKRLHERPGFVVGTPGRLLDLEDQRKINFWEFNSIVLDEVDRMLDMGFIYDVNRIISKLPKNRQSLFFSATLARKVQGVMGKFIYNPIMISVKTADTADTVYQDVVELRGRDRADMLREILDKKEVSKALVFMRTKRRADLLHRNLRSIGFQVAVLHGNKTQNQRQRSLQMFDRGKVNVLVATDVASRGIDVDNISHVINFDLPETYDDYIHRIGRTGRADKKGIALTFIG